MSTDPFDAVATLAPEREFIAYVVGPDAGFSLVPAARARAWMDATSDRFANRCLPMLIGNQAGWAIINHCEVEATWDGGTAKESIKLMVDPTIQPTPAVSHFGHGILTWQLPWLFRTPPEFDLLIRGPANFPKDGAFALDGIIETSWAVATFTMNWKMTRPNVPIRFSAGDPIAMVLPQRRGDLESFSPRVAPIESSPDDAAGHRAWSDSRGRFMKMLRETTVPLPTSQAWEKHYFRGTAPNGVVDESHQSKLNLRSFARTPPAGSPAPVVPVVEPAPEAAT